MNQPLAAANQRSVPEKLLLDLRAMSKSAGTIQALVEHLATDRVLSTGKQTLTTGFAQVGKTVVRVDTICDTEDLVFNWARNKISSTDPVVWPFISVASEADLIDALKSARTGQIEVQLRQFLRIVRAADEPAQPVEIKIVNRANSRHAIRSCRLSGM